MGKNVKRERERERDRVAGTMWGVFISVIDNKKKRNISEIITLRHKS